MKSPFRSLVISCATLVSLFGPTPILAASGWYFLAPPLSAYNEKADYLDGITVLDESPLSKWDQFGAFDRAKDCEEAKDSRWKTQHRAYSSANSSYLKSISTKNDDLIKRARLVAEKANAQLNALSAGKCTKSDDPRLLK